MKLNAIQMIKDYHELSFREFHLHYGIMPNQIELLKKQFNDLALHDFLVDEQIDKDDTGKVFLVKDNDRYLTFKIYKGRFRTSEKYWPNLAQAANYKFDRICEASKFDERSHYDSDPNRFEA